MSTFVTKELLEPAIRRIHQDAALTVKEIKLSKPDLAGAHFATGVEAAEVHVSSPTSNTDNVIHIFIKRPSHSEAHKNMLETMDIFQKEADAYNVLIPELINFSKPKGVKLEDSIPVCYFASNKGNESSIILEDLSFQGYKMFPYSSTEPQDIDHVTLVLTAMAKLHAVSYSMKETVNIPEKFQSLEEILFHDKPDSFLFTLMKPMFQFPIVLFDPSSKVRKDMEKFYDRGFEHIVKLVQPGIEHFTVINHGDCWSNNMLFKYDDNGKPTNVKLVDWQVTRYCSLGFELNYYFSTSTTTEFRKNHLQDMLKLYYKEFTAVVGKLGAEMKFTFDEMYEEYKSKQLLGFMMVPGMLTVGLQSKGDHSDPDDIQGADLMDGFRGAMKKIMANPKKKEIMIKVLTDVHEELEELLDDL